MLYLDKGKTMNENVKPLKVGSCFTGIGGFELGLQYSFKKHFIDYNHEWFCEINKFSQKILKKHWPNVPIYDDVTKINKHELSDIDILLSGFPCQDISVAGKGEGINGKKSGLYWQLFNNIICPLRPKIIVLENVPAITFRGLGEVLSSLSVEGYNAEWTIKSASEFGAPHVRKRWWLVAYSNCIKLWKQQKPQKRKGKKIIARTCKEKFITNSNCINIKKQSINTKCMEKKSKFKQRCSSINRIKSKNYWEKFPTQSPICRRNDGVSDRVHRIRALGNAIVPQVAEWVFDQIIESGLLNSIR